MSWVDAVMGDQHYLLFTYTDRMAGPSGKGVPIAGATATLEEAHAAAEHPVTTVRLPGVNTAPIPPEWLAHLRLPPEPPWMAFFAPKTESPWRADPLLSGKFHPQMADDIQVAFVLVEHKTVEQMWVRLVGVERGVGYRGTLLNTSQRAPELSSGANVLVRATPSKFPVVWVPPAAAANLVSWSSVCEACGFDLVFLPMEELVRMQFPSAPPGAVMERFTTRCLLCRETMHVTHASASG